MENLLDKFIRNEKKAKLWAALSLLAFCAVATTVMVVAYKIKDGKNGKDGGQTITTAVTDMNQVPDTVFISKEDPAIAILINDKTETIRLVTDSLRDLQIEYQKQLQEVDKYIDRLKACENKPPAGDPPPPPVPEQPVSVMIYTVKVSGITIEKIMELIRQSGASKSGYTFNTSTVPANSSPKLLIRSNAATTVPANRQLERRAAAPPAQKYYAGIKYFDVKFANEVTAIANKLNNSSKLFVNWQGLQPVKTGALVSKADIEVWLIAPSFNN